MTGDYAVFQVAQPWIESEATWENVQNDKKWINAGGDFITQAVARVTWPRSNGNTWIKFNVLPLVKNFVKYPDMNYGVLIKNVSGAQEIRFPSSEDSSAGLRPRLTITYEEGTATVIPQTTFTLTGAALKIRPDGLHITIDGKSTSARLNVSRSDGRQAYGGFVAAGSSRSVSGLGAGVYIITLEQAGRTNSTAVSIIR